MQVPGQGPTSYLDAAQREKALQSMQQMSSAQIVSATANMHPRMGPPVTYGGFWQHPGLGQAPPQVLLSGIHSSVLFYWTVLGREAVCAVGISARREEPGDEPGDGGGGAGLHSVPAWQPRLAGPQHRNTQTQAG